MRTEDSATRVATSVEPFAQVRETHTGVVFLYGERAYKAKKPVTTDFLDFGTPAAREHACRRELGLNQRLAPDVYLGVAHLSDPLGGPAEPLLVMRRMPDDRRLSTMLAAGELDPGEFSTLATVLADFHAHAERSPEIDREGTVPALRRRWRVLFHGLAAQPPAAIDPDHVLRAEHWAMRFLDGRAALLGGRINAGRMVDGHGDLLAEDIFALPDGFRLLDCLDFDDRLRYVDGLDDAAFLAMDLEFRGHAELADAFLDAYQHAAGDPAPIALRRHYIAYRAMVRAKTDRIRAAQHDPAAPASAARHLELALAQLAAARVRLTLVGGLPGTGKSTVATRLADRTGATVISSDAVRAELRASGEITGPAGNYGAGAYTAAARALVYERMLRRARPLLEHGHSVVLDASWLDPDERRRATALAEHTASDLIMMRCACPQPLAAARIGTRTAGNSEATPAIAGTMAASVPAWDDAALLDTTAPPAETMASALDAWNR
ncbi:AAA family ATPase [Nocardia inohanensis]|uniref:bifunctional aminoglycoside phosphotransferase/ATP-binding protein n=1 Tax=Nocardia inohanensis TaxID=209246 RepID=UPI000ABE57B4|nr:AAA family ATPase [Nocardia inohanensis]